MALHFSANLAELRKRIDCDVLSRQSVVMSQALVPRFSYHFTLAVEAPMATTSGWPSPLMSATTTPDAAICVSRVWRSHFKPEASAA